MNRDSKSIGHACGHPLIAIAGVGASLAVAEALVKHDIAGRVLLLGTPAEEGGGGKIVMLKEGAYSSMNACLMLHPAPTSMIGSWLAVQPVNVKYKGQTAHAGAAPWEGINALDAAVLAYNNISVLRQQIKPNERVHGILSGEDWSANVIPGNSHLLYNIRAPTKKDLKLLVERVKRCFEAAALATGCEMEIEWVSPSSFAPHYYLSCYRLEIFTLASTLILPGHNVCRRSKFSRSGQQLPKFHA